MNDQLVLYHSRLKIVGFLILLGAVGSLTLWIGVTDEHIALIGSLICWVGFLRWLSKLLDNSPQVIIDEEGIKDFRGRFGSVPWEDIDLIRIVSYRSYKALAIQFRNPEKYQQQMPSLERAIRAPDQWIGWGHLAKNFTGLDRSIYDVWSYVAELKASGVISLEMQ